MLQLDLEAKQAITEVIHRYCRAMDRMDAPLALSCWHPGGTDDTSPGYSGPAAGFVDWVFAFHARCLYTRHAISNVLIEVEGDRAGAESYGDVILRFRRDDGLYDLATVGRYLDHFEKIDGVWAIRHRQSLAEWHRVERCALTLRDFQNPPLVEPGPGGGAAPERGRRDRADPSYRVLP